jgi:conjugal transfer pilus assembly protein TraW
LQKTGELSKLEKKWEREVKSGIVRPRSVGLTTLKTTYTFHYDPTFVANQDVFNTSGQLVVKKGTRVNPLAMFPLFHKTLLFYNDDDKRQRAFVQHYLKDHPATTGERAVKPILVQGNIKEAAKALGGRPVYFDQGGKITQKLSIEQVPAVVTRDGNQLLIVIVGEEALPHG